MAESLDTMDGRRIVPPLWVVGREYAVGQLVTYGDRMYRCVVAVSAGQSPDVAPEKWDGEASRQHVAPAVA